MDQLETKLQFKELKLNEKERYLEELSEELDKIKRELDEKKKELDRREEYVKRKESDLFSIANLKQKREATFLAKVIKSQKIIRKWLFRKQVSRIGKLINIHVSVVFLSIF